MSDFKLAERYAKPLLDLAKEQGVVDDIYRDFSLLKLTCDQNSELAAVLQNPVIRGYKKLGILKALFESKFNALSIKMFEVMARKNRESILYTVSQAFIKMYQDYKGIAVVTLETAIPFEPSQKEQLIKKLESSLKKTIELKEVVNPNLIGGFVIHIGNSQIDSSIKSTLQRIKMNFIDNLYK